MMMVLQTVLVTDDLPVELVDQFVDGGVEISVARFREHVIALDVNVAFGALPVLFGADCVNPHESTTIRLPTDPAGIGTLGVAGAGDHNILAARTRH